jgi:hypothetical protein
MTMHGEKVGSRKVEPWQKKAHFLLRELARIWYGKGSKYIPHLSEYDFGSYFVKLVYQYGEDRGICERALAFGLVRAEIRFRKWHGMRPRFRTPAYWALWTAQSMLFKGLKREFFSDWRIKLILKLAHRIALQRERYNAPPYKPFRGLQPLAYYEALEAWEPSEERGTLPF